MGRKIDRVTRRQLLAAGTSAVGVSMAGCLGDDTADQDTGEPADTTDRNEVDEWGDNDRLAVTTATQYQGPNCACCDGYAEYLDENIDGSLETKVRDDVGAVKDEFGIERELQSCHTVEIDDYVIEGHIPVEVINILLNDEPDIQGIALPGMPAGSPGMGGQKDGTWTVYELTDAEEQTVFVEY